MLHTLSNGKIRIKGILKKQNSNKLKQDKYNLGVKENQQLLLGPTLVLQVILFQPSSSSKKDIDQLQIASKWPADSLLVVMKMVNPATNICLICFMVAV